MNEELSELTAGLAELADTPAPEAVLDVARAQRTGRGRLRRRRLAGVAGAVVILVTAGLLGAGFRDRHDGAPMPAVSPTVGPTSITANVRFGWLPDWADSGPGYRVEKSQAYATVKKRTDMAPALKVTLTPAGSKPGAQLVQQDIEQQEAPKVNGRTAYWLKAEYFTSGPPSRTYLLRWQVPDGRWAELLAEHLPANSEQEVLRVAAGVVFGAVESPLPVRFSDADGPVRAGDAELIRWNGLGNSPWTLAMGVELGGRELNLWAETRTPQPSTPSPLPGSKGWGHPDGIVPSNGECRREGQAYLCLSTGSDPELTPETRAFLQKVLGGIKVVPDFK